MKRWGATEAEWSALAELCLPDLRPCVCDPTLEAKQTLARPQGGPALHDFSKRPSRVYSDGKVAGITGWRHLEATERDVAMWSASPAIGAGFVGRNIKAVDIDIDDPAKADEVDDAINAAFDFDLPMRSRPNIGRRLCLFRIKPEPLEDGQLAIPAVPKHVIHTAHGQIEWLFERQFFALAGRHHSGDRYSWPYGMPKTLLEIPEITHAKLMALIRQLNEDFGIQPEASTEGATDVDIREPDQVFQDDPLYKYVLAQRGAVKQADGTVAVICPWHKQHESTNGAELDVDRSKTVFFPKGLGGQNRPGFRCMHESHPRKNVGDYIEAIGYTVVDEFDIVPEPDPDTPVENAIPAFTSRTSKGVVSCTDLDLSIAMSTPGYLFKSLHYDDFRQQLYINGEEFQDHYYTRMAIRLNQSGMESVNDGKLRRAVALHGMDNRHDEAIEWINTLKWDGEDRLKHFAHRVLRVPDTDYHRAVIMYLFSAMAARIIEPGAKVDMVPILQATEGVRKSSFVEALAPLPDTFQVHTFSDSADNAARKLRGAIAVEIEELKGLNSREEDFIKSWVTTTHDTWVPKYMEHTVKAPRRFVAIGTTNRLRMLPSAAGARRWLPISVCTLGGVIDTDYVRDNRDQLWAQGKELFLKHGVLWQDAEELAREILPQHQILTSIGLRLSEWLKNPVEESLSDIGAYSNLFLMRHALGQASRGQYGEDRVLRQIEAAMEQLGYVDEGDGKWRLPFV